MFNFYRDFTIFNIIKKLFLFCFIFQRGINITQFCKDFNARTENMITGVPIPTRVYVNPDRSYRMVLYNPTFTYYLKQAAGVQRGAMGNFFFI